MITFEQAFKKLEHIAQGRYFTVYYQAGKHSTDTGGEGVSECRLYIGGDIDNEAVSTDFYPTFEQCFTDIEQQLNIAPPPCIDEIIERAQGAGPKVPCNHPEVMWVNGESKCMECGEVIPQNIIEVLKNLKCDVPPIR